MCPRNLAQEYRRALGNLPAYASAADANPPRRSFRPVFLSARQRAGVVPLQRLAAEYASGGTLDVNKLSAAPVSLGGRGDLLGSYNSAGIFFLGAYLNWKL